MSALIQVYCTTVTCVIIMLTPAASLVGGESALFFPPMELRTVPLERWPFVAPKSTPLTFQNQVSAGNGPPFQSQAVASLLTPASTSAAAPASVGTHDDDGNSNAMRELLSAIGLGAAVEPEHSESRAEVYAREPYSRHHFLYDYSESPHDYWQSPYQEDDYSYEPAPPIYHPHHSYHGYSPLPPKPLLKPVLPKPVLPKPLLPALPVLPKPALPKPALSSVSSKLPALVSFVQGLLGIQTAGSGVATAGTTLSSALTQLLAAKTGLRGLVNKLLVPIVVLVLINLEVIALTWWLWPDCPQPAPAPAPTPAPVHTPAFPAKPTYYYRDARLT